MGLRAMLGLEKRSGNYTDTDPVTAALLLAREGQLPRHAGTPGRGIPWGSSVAEAAAGILGRCLSVARITPEAYADAIAAEVLLEAGRDLIRYGESIWLIEVDTGCPR